MRPGQQNKRGRGRGNNNGGGGNNNNNNFNRKGGNPLTRTYDSSGPDVKIRGTAQHIAEKYAQLARDAQSSGDRVIAENYLQHAEHYNRIIAAAQAQMQERFQRDDRSDYNDRDNADRDGDELDTADNDDVVIVQPPRQQQREQQQAAPAAPVQQAEAIDGTGPQPEIEGIPAEVVMEEEGSAAPQRERQPRRRNAGSRPRRPRRGAEGEAAGEDGASAEAPVLAEAASE
ncbi:hypothetical protein FHT82_003866 [Rhizobium sp. BK275]|uniref:DUF4167 domain-containing protein n=1 Tax=unclassified Rhizobium TaxID=2613769 RepID=UPI001617A0C6|nr:MULTISPECIES: DUF4167 domain-containing protein [unclassified Rhizobium]MBB3391094.1 hypothetical protein [Rhizobium sp. BK275]MBB3411816.1 hypothetical protein [Rhizobium sp. BK316]